MFSAVNKIIATAAISLAAATALWSCGDNSQEKAAQKLYADTETLIGEKNYTGALTLLDTLDTKFATQTTIRRKALALRVKAIEGQAIDSIAESDARLCRAQIAVDSLKDGFKYMKSNVGLEGYYIANSASDNVLNTTGIQARITEDGLFYIVANVQGRSIGINSLEFADGAETAATLPASPGRLVAVEGSELISFKPEEVSDGARWLKEHPGASAYTIVGSRAGITSKLTPKLYKEITGTFDYSQALRELKLASIKREKFERRLQIARDQLANLETTSEAEAEN